MDTVAEFHHPFLTTLRSLCKDEVAFQKAVALINSEFSQRAAQLENHHVCSLEPLLETLGTLHGGVALIRKNGDGECYLAFSKGKLLEKFNLAFDAQSAVPLSQILAPPLLDEIEHRCKRAFSGEIAELEFLFEERWIRAVFYPIERNASGAVSAILSISDDITAQKYTEQALHRSELDFQLIFDHAPSGIVFVRKDDGYILTANQAFVQLTGYTLEELRHIGWQRLTHPDDLARELQLVHELKTRQRPSYQIEKRYIRKDGSTIWVNLIASRVEVGSQKPHYVVVVTDITAQKQAEMALQESQSLLKSLYDTLPIGVCLTDEQGYFFEVNRAYCDLCGYTPEELIGKHFTVVIPSQDRPRALEAHTAFVAGQSHIIGEWVLQHKDGSLRNIYVTAALLTRADGKRFKVTAVQDITKEKARQNALQSTIDFLYSIYYGVDTDIFVIDVEPSGTFRVAGLNPAHERHTGIPNEKLVGRTLDELTDILSADTIAKIKRRYQTCVETGQTQRYESRLFFEPSNKSVNWLVQITPLKDADGRIYRLVGTAVDISARLQAEDNLRQMQSMLEETERIAHIGSWQLDWATKRITWSAEVFRIHERDMALGEPTLEEIFQLLSPEDAQRLQALFEQAARANHQSQVEFETCIRTFAGKEKWIYAIAKVQRDSHGNLIRLYGSLMDISQRKAAEFEKEKIHQQLLQAQKMESLGVLASGIAHEFNNILQGILGYATMLRNRLQGSVEQEKVSRIEANVHRAAAIVKQMLGFARQTKMNSQPLHLRDCISGAIQIFEPTLDKRIKVSVDLQPNVPLVEADKGQMEQVLLNLAVNARDAIVPLLGETRSHGHIAFRLERATPELLEKYALPRSQAYVHVAVSDNGTGIPQDIQSKIFDPFFTTKETGKGTGLGLSTVYGIVKNHQGYIFLDSTMGVGTTFHLFFPAYQRAQTASTAATGAHVRLATAKAHKILLIEDETEIRESVSMLLKEHGYMVCTASNGFEGIALFEAGHGNFDAVILDINMPEVNGLEVLHHIKHSYSGAKVILTTGYLEPNLSKELRAEGVSCIVPKPYEIETLLDALTETLSD
jgi:two-component system cell cycle sensor histidine kinase/response regulator CckA